MAITTAIDYMVRVANDDKHGYTQDWDRRWGPVDYDCSSLVITALREAGYAMAGATYTGNMLAPMLSSGFKDVKSSCNMATGAGLEAGDVLLHTTDHVAMYIGGGKIAHAVSNENGGIKGGQSGDQNGKEITVADYYNRAKGWQHVLRAPKADSIAPLKFKVLQPEGLEIWLRHTPEQLANSNTKSKLSKGDIITATAITHDGWLQVDNAGETAWLEVEYTEQIDNGILPLVDAPKTPSAEACPYSEPTLNIAHRLRFTGTAARWFQWHLIRAGYPSIVSDPKDQYGTDGYAYEKTWEAIDAITSKAGLGNGPAGPKTREAIKQAALK